MIFVLGIVVDIYIYIDRYGIRGFFRNCSLDRFRSWVSVRPLDGGFYTHLNNSAFFPTLVMPHVIEIRY